MNKIIIRLFGVILISAGFIIVLNQSLSIIGYVIGAEQLTENMFFFLGLFLIIFGIIMLFESRNRRYNIDNVVYEEHALERMQDHRIYPSVVREVIEHGEYYKLAHVQNEKATRGATQAYLQRDVAVMAPKARSLEYKPKARSVLVLTGKEGEVKTVYLMEPKDISKFIDKYVKQKQLKKAA